MRGEDGVFCSHAALIDPEADFEMAQVLKKHLDRFRAYWSINPNYLERIEKDIKQFSRMERFVRFKFLSDYHKYPITSS